MSTIFVFLLRIKTVCTYVFFSKAKECGEEAHRSGRWWLHHITTFTTFLKYVRNLPFVNLNVLSILLRQCSYIHYFLLWLVISQWISTLSHPFAASFCLWDWLWLTFSAVKTSCKWLLSLESQPECCSLHRLPSLSPM